LSVAILLTGFPLGAQTVETALARSGYTEAQKDTIIAFCKASTENGIPPELLLPKLEEGIAKHIPAQPVLEALKREVEGLLQARTLILASKHGQALLADRASWARTANLLAGGVPEAEVSDLILLCASRTDAFRPASYLYVALLEWGLGRGTALELISALLESTLSPQNYMGIMDLLATGRRRRLAPEEVVQRIVENLQHSNSIKELEKWIY
jgi:hypothetical protein